MRPGARARRISRAGGAGARSGWWPGARPGFLLLPLVFAASGLLSFPASAQVTTPTCDAGTTLTPVMDVSGMTRQYHTDNGGTWRFGKFTWTPYTCRVNGRDPAADTVASHRIETLGTDGHWVNSVQGFGPGHYLGNRTLTVPQAGASAVKTSVRRVATVFWDSTLSPQAYVVVGEASIPFTLTTGPPGVPANVTAEKAGAVGMEGKGGAIRLSWDPPGNAAERPFDGYLLERRIDNGGWALVEDIRGREAHTRIEVPSAVGSYRYRVRTYTGVDGSGNRERVEGSYSRETSALTAGPPDPPTNITATKDGLSITVSWGIPSNSATRWHDGYVWERSIDEGEWEELGDINWRGVETEYDTPTVSGSYRYRVKSYALIPGGNERLESAYTDATPAIEVVLGDPDVNDDDEIDANDALILYYAYSLRSELGNGR